MQVFNLPRTIWLASAILGCSRPNEAMPKPSEVWHRGDIAIVEPTAADFFESQVLEVKGGQLKVQRMQGGESMHVGIGDAYPIPKAKPKLPVFAWAICRTQPQTWFACRVIRSGGAGHGAANGAWEASVQDALGNELVLRDSDAWIEPTSLSAMNIQRRFEQSSRRVSFEKSLREAGHPRRQPGWQLAPRRMVIAKRQGQWFGAQVVEVDDDRVVVRWDGEKGTTDLSIQDVSPQPPACGMAVRGDRALRRPAGHGGAWTPVAVVAVDGTDASVEDVERSRTTLQLRDLCPLGTAPTPSQ